MERVIGMSFLQPCSFMMFSYMVKGTLSHEQTFDKFRQHRDALTPLEWSLNLIINSVQLAEGSHARERDMSVGASSTSKSER